MILEKLADVVYKKLYSNQVNMRLENIETLRKNLFNDFCLP